MAIISGIIGPSIYEIIRNRIADIFIDEFTNQYVYTADPDLNVTITLEKKITFDKTELTEINISFVEGDFDNQHVGQSDGTFKFNFDAICASPDTDANTGDSIASLRAQKLMGIGYNIITNAVYRTLGFLPGNIHRVQAGSMGIGDITQGDAKNTIMGRFVITVKATQTTELLLGALAEGYDTQIKIGTSDVGFSYTINN